MANYLAAQAGSIGMMEKGETRPGVKKINIHDETLEAIARFCGQSMYKTAHWLGASNAIATESYISELETAGAAAKRRERQYSQRVPVCSLPPTY